MIYNNSSKEKEKMRILESDLKKLKESGSKKNEVVGDVISRVQKKADNIEVVDPEKNPFIQKSAMCPCTIS